MMANLAGMGFSRAALVAVVLSTASCAATGRPGESSSFLIVDSMQAASGARPTVFGGSLASDVLTRVDGTPTILEDLGIATFRLAMKDPGVTTPTPINFITLRRYRVTFSRSDGRNTPGVDVPYAFDGAITATVGTTATTVPIVLVRIQAKSEAPLKALAGGGGAVAISTVADIAFQGADQAGREVTVSARISVTFADWSDEP